jgi:hypothetical protein
LRLFATRAKPLLHEEDIETRALGLRYHGGVMSARTSEIDL